MIIKRSTALIDIIYDEDLKDKKIDVDKKPQTDIDRKRSEKVEDASDDNS